MAHREVVLVGAGHAHVQILRMLAMRRMGAGWAADPWSGARVTLVVDRPVAIYSGMIPGFLAGEYPASALEIDAWPLARRAGARVVLAACTGVDRQRGRIFLQGRPDLPYDLASLDIGSTVAGLELPGVRAHALATRPISSLVRAWPERLAGLPDRVRVAVVGGGAAGVEAAFCVGARLRREGRAAEVCLLDSHAEILRGASGALRRRVEAAAAARGLAIRRGVSAAGLEPGRLLIRSGAEGRTEEIGCDLCVWAPGAAAHRLEGLPLDGRGFVRTGRDLRVEGCDNLFAVGDCAAFGGDAAFPEGLPKAGVYAVRQGPILMENLRWLLAGRQPEAYRPQRDFLALLNVGDGTAIGAKWGVAFEGAWVWRWKDRIDRAFMRRFQLLSPEGAPLPALPPPALMEQPCGGCAAKLAQEELEAALSDLPEPPGAEPGHSRIVWGVGESEDVALIRDAGGLTAWNLDAFTAPTDDPWLCGRLAALNALSDLHVKGARPELAMAIVGLPEEGSAEAMRQVMRGAREVLDAEGVRLAGGHTIRTERLLAGFSVTGPVEEPIPQRGAQPGDALILTRALGTGVLLRAEQAGLVSGPEVQALLAQILRPQIQLRLLRKSYPIRAATDVTGFGLVGHLKGMLAGGCPARLDLRALPALPGALRLLGAGVRSSFHAQNARGVRHFAAPVPDDIRVELLFDPQTAGGVLLAVAPDQAGALLEEIRRQEPEAAVIGEIVRENRGSLIHLF